MKERLPTCRCETVMDWPVLRQDRLARLEIRCHIDAVHRR